MKNFFKIVFATFFALVLFAVLLSLVGIGLLAGISRLSVGARQEPKIEHGSFLAVDLSINLTDTPPPSESTQALNRLFGGDNDQTVSLRAMVRAIYAAATDDRIAGIFLHGSFEPEGYGSGYAALKEMRAPTCGARRSSRRSRSRR